MPRIGIIRQDQVRGSGGGDQRSYGYRADFGLAIDAVENAQNTLIDDLNYIRSAIKVLHGNSSWWEAERLSQGIFVVYSGVTETSYVALGPNGLTSVADGMAACIMTNDFTYGDVTSNVVGKIGLADARKTSVDENAAMFYELAGVISRTIVNNGLTAYRVCSVGFSGVTKLYNADSGLIDRDVVLGQVYYLGSNGTIVTKDEAIAAVDTHRLQKIGYGAYNPDSPLEPVLVVSMGEPLET